MSRQWTCRKCRHVNARTSSRRCAGCGENTKRAPRVPKHAETLRDDDYQVFMQANLEIHGVGEVCAVCGKEPSSPGGLDREHGHAPTERSFGRPRGLACRGMNGCNKVLGRITLEQARLFVAYLERVEEHYAAADELDIADDPLAYLELAKRAYSGGGDVSRRGRRQGPRRRCGYCGARCWGQVCANCTDLPRLNPWIDPAWLMGGEAAADLTTVAPQVFADELRSGAQVTP